jgi:hypothetical protein
MTAPIWFAFPPEVHSRSRPDTRIPVTPSGMSGSISIVQFSLPPHDG